MAIIANKKHALNDTRPYIRACESPRLLLSPTPMRDVLFKRHLPLDKSMNLDDMDALKALCAEHFNECDGLIRGSKIEYYELHLKKVRKQYKIVKISI